jgi:hypothetical protein
VNPSSHLGITWGLRGHHKALNEGMRDGLAWNTAIKTTTGCTSITKHHTTYLYDVFCPLFAEICKSKTTTNHPLNINYKTINALRCDSLRFPILSLGIVSESSCRRLVFLWCISNANKMLTRLSSYIFVATMSGEQNMKISRLLLHFHLSSAGWNPVSRLLIYSLMSLNI